MNRCFIFFVEGDTEVEFYKYLISYIRQKYVDGKFKFYIKYQNVKGVGGFKNIALRKFLKDIKPKYKGCEFIIVLCRDTDVFEIAEKPPVKWDEVEKEFKKKGAKKVLHIQAIHSIEDWFLYDRDGIISFLRLRKNTNIVGKNGYEKLKKLFKMANKMYYKGVKSDGLVEKLNMELIEQNIYQQLEPLYEEFGVI